MTDYCTRIFGKPLRELSYEDIENYFKEAKEENEYLEFKSGQGDFEGSFVNNIIRTIVGFLNSSGGVLIWGAPKDVAPEKGKPKETKGELIPLDILKGKDDLINRISTSISYMPKGIHVEKLEKSEKFLYIFEVQESESKPHQYSDKGIYYIRLDGQTKPAPHYIVDALFKQVKNAELEGEVHITSINIKDSILTLSLSLNISNLSRFINAKNLSSSLHANFGLFSDSNRKDLYTSNSGTLHYGPPKSFSTELLIDLIDLKSTDGIITIVLFFASDNSVAKTSKYKFNFSGISDSFDLVGKEFSDILIESFENIEFD